MEIFYYLFCSSYSKLLKNFTLAPAILESLAALNMEEDLQHQVFREVLKTIPAVPYEFLPNMIRFLMSGIENDDAEEVTIILLLWSCWKGEM